VGAGKGGAVSRALRGRNAASHAKPAPSGLVEWAEELDRRAHEDDGFGTVDTAALGMWVWQWRKQLRAALASEPAQAEMPDGWHVEHIASSRDQLEQWILVGGVRPRIRIGITERDVEAGAVQALRVFADRIERGGKGAT
jgi:hypothetical protein